MNPFCQLAKNAVFAFIKEGKIIKANKNLPNDFNAKAGVFVSIFNKKDLRGCVGTFLPTQKNIAEEIISSAVSACQDTRFIPLQEKELPFLSFEVYILDRPEMIKDIEELNPKKYGILVQSSNKSGLLLPDLEGINSIDQQIEIAARKAGIDLKNEEIAIYKFLAKKYVSD
ncbi:MAG: AmmeMemoRadiSam system protein A [Candidatus Paceibacterota bacterium]|jgi:AmmeMemoRadiSam system protein A